MIDVELFRVIYLFVYICSESKHPYITFQNRISKAGFRYLKIRSLEFMASKNRICMGEVLLVNILSVPRFC